MGELDSVNTAADYINAATVLLIHGNEYEAVLQNV